MSDLLEWTDLQKLVYAKKLLTGSARKESHIVGHP